MPCDICKTKQPTIFLTQIIEGKIKKMNFCEECSKKKGMNEAALFGLPELLLEISKAQESQEMDEEASTLVCKYCGFSQIDFKKTGRLGCSKCYGVFREGLSNMLHNMHGSLTHIGKVPVKVAAMHAQEKTLKQLQTNLMAAIAKEQYEEAASLRDKIDQLKEQANQRVSPVSMIQKMLLLDDHEETGKRAAV